MLACSPHGRAVDPARRGHPNLIVSDHTQIPHLVAVLVIMAVMSAALLGWAKRQGWW
ncbi:hypothetical protein [Dactylosporangium salmoneum]|uniref:hypothetical protein n=1 Tax=Dactylosporangium salmoneum TaxID=53361 RepID=UPI0031D59BAA